MNVEEGMELLRDPKVWNVELTPRAGVHAKARPSAWQFATVGIAAAAAIAVVVGSIVIVGNLQPKPPVSGPVVTETPEPSPTSTPDVVEPTGQAVPPAVFDGDCTNFASDEAMSTAAGQVLTAPAFADDDLDGIEDEMPADYLQLGVITCGWNGDQGSIWLTILRDDVAPSDSRKACDSYSWGEASMDKTVCVVDITANGIRVSGAVRWPSKSESKAVAAGLVDYIEATDFSSSQGSTPPADPDAWLPLDCAAVSPMEVNGKPVDLTLDILGSDAGSLPVEDQIGEMYSANGCYGDFAATGGEEGRVSFTAFAHGAWRFDRDLAAISADGYPFEPVAIAGFDHGFLAQSETNRTYTLVSGSNYLKVSITGQADDADIIDQIAAKLTP